tara:strand:- start:225 stop:815 length:591 start_codon:yes stop_codon:yes gene_type:complete
MIKLGIFILPNSSIKKKILFFKNNVKRNFGVQTYLNHIPHCTIYVFETSKKNLKEIKKINRVLIKRRKSFEIDKTDVFFNDPITKKNTYIIKLKKNLFLNNLQKMIVDLFSKFALKKKQKFNDNLMNKNYKLFGYPFIKSNWKPHFTIASISMKKNQKNFINMFKLTNIRRKQSIKNISIYQIKKNKHKFICEIKI